METLKQVFYAIEDIGSDASRLSKEAKIKKYLDLPYFQEVVKYAYDFNKRYHMTNVDFISDHGYDLDVIGLFTYLDYLATLSGASDEMKRNLGILSSIDQETNELVNRIVNKDLRCGASEGSFSKYIKDLPVFEIMTCLKVISKFLKWNKNKPYFWSIKKNGVRTINTCYKDYVENHLSRSGLEYPNFSIYDKELIKLANLIVKNSDLYYPIPIDGESISSGKNFNKVMTQTRRLKNADLSSYVLNIFDIPCNKPLSERYSILEKIFNENTFEKLALVKHHLCTFTEQELLDLTKDVVENSPINTPECNIDEGIVIKMADVPYIWKEHSKEWCKVKLTDTLDLPVVGYEFGKGRLSDVVGKLIVEFKGVKVGVGSGLNDQQRFDFLTNLPALVEIKYKEITPDGSLREPIFVRVRDDKKIVSEE